MATVKWGVAEQFKVVLKTVTRLRECQVGRPYRTQWIVDDGLFKPGVWVSWSEWWSSLQEAFLTWGLWPLYEKLSNRLRDPPSRRSFKEELVLKVIVFVNCVFNSSFNEIVYIIQIGSFHVLCRISLNVNGQPLSLYGTE